MFASLRWVTSFIPGIFAGLVISAYFQYKGVVYQKFQPQFDSLFDKFNNGVDHFLSLVPRFQHPKDRKID